MTSAARRPGASARGDLATKPTSALFQASRAVGGSCSKLAARAELAGVELAVAQREEVEAEALVLGVVVGAGVRRRGDDAGARCRRARSSSSLRMSSSWTSGSGAWTLREVGRGRRRADRRAGRTGGRPGRAPMRRSVQVASVSDVARRDLVEDRRQAREQHVGELGVVAARARRSGRRDPRARGGRGARTRRRAGGRASWDRSPCGLRSGAGSAPTRGARPCRRRVTAPAIAWPASRSWVRRRGGAVQVLARATSTASGLRSEPIVRMPFARASTSVVPSRRTDRGTAGPSSHRRRRARRARARSRGGGAPGRCETGG